jgi:hypothetical protein
MKKSAHNMHPMAPPLLSTKYIFNSALKLLSEIELVKEVISEKSQLLVVTTLIVGHKTETFDLTKFLYIKRFAVVICRIGST